MLDEPNRDPAVTSAVRSAKEITTHGDKFRKIGNVFTIDLCYDLFSDFCQYELH